jgi:hypothetical protein
MMAVVRTGLQRFSVTMLNVLGVAWVSIHAFLIVATLYAIFSPLVLSAVPFFVGTRLLARGVARWGAALTLAGALLMFGADLYVVVIFPSHPGIYPVAPMLRLFVRVYGHEDLVTPVTPVPAVHL